jgi:hypothetical protein
VRGASLCCRGLVLGGGAIGMCGGHTPRTIDSAFSLASIHTSASEEAEATTKEDPEIDATIARVITRLRRD